MFPAFSQNYSELIPGSAVGTLTRDSGNVVQLILDAYAVSHFGRNLLVMRTSCSVLL